MKQNDSWKTWLLVVSLLFFAGIASAVVPFLSQQANAGKELRSDRENTVITIDLEAYVLGDQLVEIEFLRENIHGKQLTVWQAFGILLGFTLVSIGGAGLLLAILSNLVGQQVSSVLSDEGYKTAASELAKKDKILVKSIQQERQPSEPEISSRAYWPVIVTSSLVLLFVWIIGVVLSKSILEGVVWSIANSTVQASSIVTPVLLLISILVIAFITRQRGPDGMYRDSTAGMPIDWGVIWVVVSGMLIVGVGTGISMVLQGGS